MSLQRLYNLSILFNADKGGNPIGNFLSCTVGRAARASPITLAVPPLGALIQRTRSDASSMVGGPLPFVFRRHVNFLLGEPPLAQLLLFHGTSIARPEALGSSALSTN